MKVCAGNGRQRKEETGGRLWRRPIEIGVALLLRIPSPPGCAFRRRGAGAEAAPGLRWGHLGGNEIAGR